MINILDHLQRLKINTIFFQVRSQGSVFYFSQIEPFTHLLAGYLGKKTSYDPLKFLLDEAHKRNMEVHCWINTFNTLTGSVNLNESRPLHILAAKPEWHNKIITKEGDEYWLNPGIPEVHDHIISLCQEMATNYDIDGIHLDYIRYPSRNFNDSLEYRLYGAGKKLDDWRRDNVTRLVSAIYDSITKIKPYLKIGSAPIGIYENINRSTGTEGRNDVYQDSRYWMRIGKQDYIAPQIYWPFNSKPGFEVLVKDWIKNSFNRDVYIGIGVYKSEIASNLNNYINTIRKNNAQGIAFFRYENLKSSFKGFEYFANIPPMRWKDSIPPAPPDSIFGFDIMDSLNYINLWWKNPPIASDGDTAKYYNLYRSDKKNVNINDPKNIITITSKTNFTDYIEKPSQLEYYYRVTSFDKCNNESVRSSPIIVIPLTALMKLLEPVLPKNLLYVQYSESLKKYLIDFYSARNQNVEINLISEDKKIVKNIYKGALSSGQYIFDIDKSLIKSKMRLRVTTEISVEEFQF